MKKEPKCKNCLLFDKKGKRCKVAILYNGEKFNLPVEPEDTCFFENEFTAIDESGNKEIFKPEIEQIKFWAENEKGETSQDGHGKIKVEYPESLFDN